jgi:cystathionine beta-lyase
MDEFIDRSHTNAEKYLLREKLFGTNDVMPLWVADMDLATPLCVLDTIKERLNHPILGYEIMPNSAYEAQIQWFKEHHHFSMKREWLSYSPSVVASIGCAIRAFSDEGDEVIVMSPVYPPFFAQVKENHRRLVTHSLVQEPDGHYVFDKIRLRAQITPKTKILLLCSPHNPIGRTWSVNELTFLGELCLEHNIRIISDEIHCDIVYTSHTPIASLSPALLDTTVTLLGTGKTFNMAGFCISTVCIANKEMRKHFESEQSKVHWGDGAVLSHTAFESAYRDGEIWYDELMEHLRANRDMIEIWMQTQHTLQWNPPQATYLAWIDCRAMGLGDHKLREFFIREAGLGLSAGLSFGKEGSGFMRLNFAITSQKLAQALEKLSHALRKNGYV